MNSLEFKKNEFKKFCSIIGFKPIVIEGILANIDIHYREWIEKKPDKTAGGFKKYKDGTLKTRMIRPSLDTLKLIQSNIKDRILTPIELPNNIHGGVKKRSNISNAKPHQGNKFVFTTDLQAFYPNITNRDVYETFLELGFSVHFSHWVTKLTTWKNELPQGTPTSTHIANLVFLKTDFELISFCTKHNLTYTRYIDDLTFSSQQDFKHLLNDILEIVKGAGFKLSYRKTKYEGDQSITGIKVYLNKIDAPDRIIEKSKFEVADKVDFKPFTNYLNNIRSTNITRK